MGRKNLSTVRREEITQALFRCIAKKGYLNTPVREIAREAGVNTGIIHHYFDSKEDILYRMTEDTHSKYWQAFTHFTEKHKSKPPRERLVLFTGFLLTKISGDKDLAKVFHELWNLAHHDQKLNESLRKFYRRYRKDLAGFVGKLLEEFGIDTDDARDLTDVLISVSEGACVLWFVDPRGVSLSRMSKLTTRLLESFIGLDDQQCLSHLNQRRISHDAE